MRRFVPRLIIVILVGVIILWILLAVREQQYVQQFADYTQYSSAAELEAYLSQKFEVGKTTEDDVVAFIIQSGMSPKISLDSNCNRGERKTVTIICTVRAPATDYSKEFWMNQVKNLLFDYYYIQFEFVVGGNLKGIDVSLGSRLR